MDSLNKNLIRESFDAIKPYAGEVATDFYQILFEKYPAAKPLFKSVNMKKQKKALMASLVHTVEFLDESEHLVDYLKKMGARHINYGAQNEHYEMVGDALLTVFEKYFGDHWTDELKEEWVKVYTFMANTMKSGKLEAVNQSPTKPKEPTLDELARNIAREALKKAIDAEVDEAIKELAQEKIREVLKIAFEKESKQVLSQMRRKSSAA